MKCEACVFESRYPEAPKAGSGFKEHFACALWAHSCGVTICKTCNGFSVVGGSSMGMFAVIGGERCPDCTAGRVYPITVTDACELGGDGE